MGEKRRKLSLQAFNAALKALYWRWAVHSQIENYRRLVQQKTISGRAMAPLSPFWKWYKNFMGFRSYIGQKTGVMLNEVGDVRNIHLDVPGRTCEVLLSRDARVLEYAKYFERGTKQILSKKQAYKLNAMAGAGARGTQFGFAEGQVVIQPPRPFFARSVRQDTWFSKEIAHLVLTGKRRI